jgi:very-short-patch-repair endonuclease
VLTYDHARTGATARARELRRNSTEAEKLVWRALRSSLPQYKWRRQMPIGPYFADVACHAEKLVIELDGVIGRIADELSTSPSRRMTAL